MGSGRSGRNVRLDRRRDTLGIELARVRLGPTSLAMHMADAVTLLVGVSGSGMLPWRGEAIACVEGTALIVPPLEMVVLRTDRVALEVMIACVPAQLVKASTTGGDLKDAADWLRAAWSATERAGSGDDFRALIELLPDAGDARRGRARPGHLEPGPVRRARQLLENNYRVVATLDELASTVGVSKFHLVRCFAPITACPRTHT